jgi:hypothetical protein
MAGWSAVLAAIVGLMIALAASIARMQNRAVVQSCLVVMVVAISFVGGWWAWAPPLSFHNLTRVLPVIALTSAVACIVQSRRSRDDPVALPRSIVAASFSIFATAMLLKMLLNARIHHYGFVLAAPASMLLIICMLSWIPAGLAPRMSRGGGRAAAVFQLAATAALLGVAACVLQVSHRTASARIYPVNNGRDSFIADARGLVINSGLRLLDEQLDPDDTLAVLPEGVMINYLARRVNPTGFTSYLPSDLAVHGEATILAAFQKKPPDYIIVIHRDTSEFEMGAFGIGYAKDLLAWITSNYSLAGQVGEIPVNQRLGLVLLKHIPPNP